MLRNYLPKIFLEKYNFLLFLLISFASLFGFLNSDTSFGFMWDWSIPSNELFLNNKLKSNELFWSHAVFGGYNNSLNFELWYWRFYGLVNLLFFGKGLFGILFIFQFLCYFGFCKLGEIYKKDFILISLFYIFSYYAFSRLIAGHINFLIFYWSLPILFVCIHELYENSLKKTSIYQILLIIVCLVVLSHPTSIISFLLLLIYFFFKKLVNSNNKKKIFYTFLFTLLIFLISQLHLTLTLFNILFDNLNILTDTHKNYFNFENTDQINNFENNKIINDRLIQHNQKSIGIVFYILSLVTSSMFYENIFLVDDIFIKTIFFSCFCIVIIYSIFISLKKIIIYKLRYNYIYLAFIIVTFIFLAGSNNLLSQILYNFIFYVSKNLFSLFANPLRFTSLFIFFLSLILLLNNNFYINKIIVLILLISATQFFFLKFYDSKKKGYEYIQTNQIIKKKTNFDEIEFEKNLRKDIASYKIVVLPPAQLAWTYSDKYNFTIPWNAIYLSKPNLLFTDSKPFEIYSNIFFFSVDNNNFNYNLLLKISNIKYIVYPRHHRVYLYKNYIKNYKNNTFDHLEDYSFILKSNFENLDLKKSKLSSENIDIYEVNNFYPEFYCPTNVVFYKNIVEKKNLQLSDNENDYYVFASLNKKINLCKKKYQLEINSPTKNIYNIKSLQFDKINSLVFNTSYDKDWRVIPNKIYKSYLEVINHIFFFKKIKLPDHFDVNFGSNYWSFDKNYEYVTVFNLNELKFYFIKIFQYLSLIIFILINFIYLIKNKWKI